MDFSFFSVIVINKQMISPWKVTFYFFVNIQIKLEIKKKKS